MISMYKFDKVRALINQGANDSEISGELGIDRKTVRKYRIANSPPKYKPRETATRIDPTAAFTAQIEEWVRMRESIAAPSVYVFLKERGYKGSLRSIERKVAALKATKPRERFFEQEYAPGEQAQFDFKEKVAVPFKTGEQICQIFIATLPYSDLFFAKAFPNRTFEAFADGMHSFFESIGGMTESIRFDNLTPVVKKILKGSERVYTDSFMKVLHYYGVRPLPCSPGKGNEKGDCERDIRTFSNRLKDMLVMSGRVFSGFEDFNTWLVAFAENLRTEKQIEAFAEEVKHLKPLPIRDEAILCQVHVTAANKHGTVVIKKSSYSVPDNLIERPVKVIISAFDVAIYQLSPKLELVATHPRAPNSKSSILLEHAISSLVRKPQAMIRWTHKEILFPNETLRSYYEFLKRQMTYGAEAEFLKSLNLIQNVSLQSLTEAVQSVMNCRSKAPFRDLKDALFPNNVCPGDLTLCQTPIKPELSKYDGLIPA